MFEHLRYIFKDLVNFLKILKTNIKNLCFEAREILNFHKYLNVILIFNNITMQWIFI